MTHPAQRGLRTKDGRIYRAALLQADEADRINRDASCEFACCPHLDMFHNHGHTSGGGFWTSCTLCNCIEETEPSPLTKSARAQEAAWERLEMASIAKAWFLFGCAAGLGAASLIWVFT